VINSSAVPVMTEQAWIELAIMGLYVIAIILCVSFLISVARGTRQ